MKHLTTFLTFSFIVFLGGCTGQLNEPFVTSSGHGSVTVSQDSIRESLFEEFPDPTLTEQQAGTLAWQKCSDWDFEGVELSGAMRGQAVQWGPGIQFGQVVPMTIRHSIDYECTGTASNQ